MQLRFSLQMLNCCLILANVLVQSRHSAPATSHVSNFLSDDLLGLVGDAQKPPLFAVEVCSHTYILDDHASYCYCLSWTRILVLYTRADYSTDFSFCDESVRKIRLALPQAWRAGNLSPSGRSLRSDLCAAAPVLRLHAPTLLWKY